MGTNTGTECDHDGVTHRPMWMYQGELLVQRAHSNGPDARWSGMTGAADGGLVCGRRGERFTKNKGSQSQLAAIFCHHISKA